MLQDKDLQIFYDSALFQTANIEPYLATIFGNSPTKIYKN